MPTATAVTTSTVVVTPTRAVAPDPSTTATQAVAPDPSTTVEIDSGDVDGFEIAELSLSGRPLTVAVADEPGLRSRGLMGVSDLGDVDGMLFSWGGAQVSARFIMRNTVIPLTIAFFGSDGRLVDVVEMVPCEAEPCPTYSASGSYAYAIEFPAGFELGADPVLEFPDRD